MKLSRRSITRGLFHVRNNTERIQFKPTEIDSSISSPSINVINTADLIQGRGSSGRDVFPGKLIKVRRLQPPKPRTESVTRRGTESRRSQVKGS